MLEVGIGIVEEIPAHLYHVGRLVGRDGRLQVLRQAFVHVGVELFLDFDVGMLFVEVLDEFADRLAAEAVRGDVPVFDGHFLAALGRGLLLVVRTAAAHGRRGKDACCSAAQDCLEFHVDFLLFCYLCGMLFPGCLCFPFNVPLS